MAVCEQCGAEMLESLGCREDVKVVIGGREFEPLRYGTEDVFLEIGEDGEWWEPVRCHDCWVPPAAVHHFGCCVEACPRCGDQLLYCGCSDEPGWVRRRRLGRRLAGWWRLLIGGGAA